MKTGEHPQVVAPAAPGAVLQADLRVFAAHAVVGAIEDLVMPPEFALGIAGTQGLAALADGDVIVQLVEIGANLAHDAQHRLLEKGSGLRVRQIERLGAGAIIVGMQRPLRVVAVQLRLIRDCLGFVPEAKKQPLPWAYSRMPASPPGEPAALVPIAAQSGPCAELGAIPAGVYHERLDPHLGGDINLAQNPLARLFHHAAAMVYIALPAGRGGMTLARIC